jgi:hypothetical protein
LYWWLGLGLWLSILNHWRSIWVERLLWIKWFVSFWNRWSDIYLDF